MTSIYDSLFDEVTKNVPWDKVRKDGITTNRLANAIADRIIELHWENNCKNITSIEHIAGKDSRIVKPQEHISSLLRVAAIQGVKPRVIYRLKKLGFKGDYTGVHRGTEKFEFDEYRRRRSRRESQNDGNIKSLAKEINEFSEDLNQQYEAWIEELNEFIEGKRA